VRFRSTSGRTWQGGGLALALGLALVALPGCYAGRFKRYDQSIADLNARADSIASAHARTAQDLADTRKLVNEHEQSMRSLRAGTANSAQDVQGRLDQIESRLEDEGNQIDDLAGRAHTRASAQPSGGGETNPGAPPVGVTVGATPTPVTHPAHVDTTQATHPKAPPAPGSPSGAGIPPAGTGVTVDPTAEYDQAVLDFTQGRFPRSLTEFRAFVAAHGATDLADNAQYGVGESFYAQGLYDSAAVAYQVVMARWPDGDKVPAALYKLGIAYGKTNHSPEARATYQALITKYPRSGEARLAQERVKEMDQR